MRTWRVEATVPAVKIGRAYRANLNIQVIAETLEQAVDACKRKHDDIVFIKVMTDRLNKEYGLEYTIDVIDAREV